MRSVAPGDPIGPALTASWYNQTLPKPRRIPPSPRKNRQHEHQNELIAHLLSGTVERFDPVGLDTRANTYDKHVDRTHHVTIEALTEYNWIIPQAKMNEAHKSQPCVYFGITYANVLVTDEAHQFVTLDLTTNKLVSTPHGKGQILVGANAGVEPQRLFISIGNFSNSDTQSGWLLHTLQSIPGRVGNQLGFGQCLVYSVPSNGLIELTDIEITAYNSQEELIEPDLIVQAKNIAGLPFIDVVPCDFTEISSSSSI